MSKWFGVAVLVSGLVSAVGCDATDAPAEDEQDDSNVCAVPDESCPTELPFPGGACTGALSCEYDDGPDIKWSFSCEDGHWDGEAKCGLIGGSCPIPPQAEGCDGAFAGQLDGATVEIGPAVIGNFASYQDGETPEIHWGGQGRSMIFYRLHLGGDDVPDCAMVTASVTPEGMPSEVATAPVTLRCGDTLRMYVILPQGNCMEPAAVETTLTVDVQGIGSKSVTLSVPGDAFCGFG